MREEQQECNRRLSSLIKHTNSANCKDEEPFWIQFPRGPAMKPDFRLGLPLVKNYITSCADIYMQQDKELGGDVAR